MFEQRGWRASFAASTLALFVVGCLASCRSPSAGPGVAGPGPGAAGRAASPERRALEQLETWLVMQREQFVPGCRQHQEYVARLAHVREQLRLLDERGGSGR